MESYFILFACVYTKTCRYIIFILKKHIKILYFSHVLYVKIIFPKTTHALFYMQQVKSISHVGTMQYNYAILLHLFVV
jgi:exoribonuclease R